MIPALWAVFLAAKGSPDPKLVGLMAIGTFAISGAGCVINDLWDRDIDPQVARTKSRPLASRELTVQVALGVTLVSLLCAWGLAAFLNPFTFGLCVAAVPLIVLYPAAKRVFPVPQLVLSLCWGFAALIGWSAVTNGLDLGAAWLWGATVLWTLGFDTVYAMADREDDRRVGVNSSALFFGDHAPQAVGIFYLGTVFLLGILGWQQQLHPLYFVSLGAAAIWWGTQYIELTQPVVPLERYGKQFGDNVKIGFLLLGGMVGGMLL
jgi:4-hydroxybenzoate polyprenyltransferase